MIKKVARKLKSFIVRFINIGETRSKSPNLHRYLDNGNEVINYPKLKNSKIVFNGCNNTLYCGNSDVILEDSTLNFNGDDSIIYLSKSNRVYKIKCDIYSNSSIFIGSNNYFNGIISMIASEQKNIIIGQDGLFSFGCWIRTADPHLVYDNITKKRINDSKSVLIGDHVWIGQGALLLKGAKIGSGSIIGANAVVAGKSIISNASYGGNPAKLLRRGIFFLSDSAHKYKDAQINKMSYSEIDKWIYKSEPSSVISYKELEKKLAPNKAADKKLTYMKTILSGDIKKDRFFVGDDC